MPNTPVILITGASSGIGAAAARLFGSHGYRVSLAARRYDRLEALAHEIESGGGTALPIATDVSKLEAIYNLVQVTLARFKRIDVLLNNAGYGRLDWLEQLDPLKDVQAQLSVDLLGVIWTARVVLPHMIDRRAGHIINMGSIAGMVGSPTYSVYAASKFGVRGFTESLRREVGVYGIKVSAIYPGGVNSEFYLHTGADRKTGITTPAWLRLSPERVAHEIWKLSQRPRGTVVIPKLMWLAVWLNWVFPGLVDWVVERRFTIPERNV